MSIFDPKAVTKSAKEAGKGSIGELEPREWIKLTMSTWALLEQIRTHPSHQMLEGRNASMTWVIRKVARDLNIDVGAL
tara:strand:- start:392 stop:625 length:234 start_codon:yes stop_codon:yes gene_type:complete